MDRDSALRLTGDAADEVTDSLARATREGVRLSRAARAGDVFEIVPPQHLVDGIKNGTLRAATPSSGDASVLVKNVKTGRVAGKQDLVKVKPTPADLIGPAAWQAMALATQQHYLAEISAKLDGIQRGVNEVLARMDDDRIGKLNHLSELAANAQVAARRDGHLSSGRVHDLRRAGADAKELWHQVQTAARRQLQQYQDGKASAEDVEGGLAMLTRATHVLAQCSEALASVPYRTTQELKAALAEEQDRLYPALPEFLAVGEELLQTSSAWEQRHADYEARRPKNRVGRRLRVPAIERHRAKGTLGIQFRPRQEALSVATQSQLLRLGSSTQPEPLTLIAEVDTDGTVLLGSAESQ